MESETLNLAFEFLRSDTRILSNLRDWFYSHFTLTPIHIGVPFTIFSFTANWFFRVTWNDFLLRDWEHTVVPAPAFKRIVHIVFSDECSSQDLHGVSWM